MLKQIRRKYTIRIIECSNKLNYKHIKCNVHNHIIANEVILGSLIILHIIINKHKNILSLAFELIKNSIKNPKILIKRIINIFINKLESAFEVLRTVRVRKQKQTIDYKIIANQSIIIRSMEKDIDKRVNETISLQVHLGIHVLANIVYKNIQRKLYCILRMKESIFDTKEFSRMNEEQESKSMTYEISYLEQIEAKVT